MFGVHKVVRKRHRHILSAIFTDDGHNPGSVQAVNFARVSDFTREVIATVPWGLFFKNNDYFPLPNDK